MTSRDQLMDKAEDIADQVLNCNQMPKTGPWVVCEVRGAMGKSARFYARMGNLGGCEQNKLVKPKNRPGPARPGHVKIALDITAVDIDLFFSLHYRYNDHV